MILRYEINHKTHKINIWHGSNIAYFTHYTTHVYSRELHESLIEQTPNSKASYLCHCWIVDNPVIYMA